MAVTLSVVLTEGIVAVQAARAETLSHDLHSVGVVLNVLVRWNAKGVLAA